MSEEDKIMYDKIYKSIRLAQRQMLERKAKLGEDVVYADENGMPYILSAAEALRRLNESEEVAAEA